MMNKNNSPRTHASGQRQEIDETFYLAFFDHALQGLLHAGVEPQAGGSAISSGSTNGSSSGGSTVSGSSTIGGRTISGVNGAIGGRTISGGSGAIDIDSGASGGRENIRSDISAEYRRLLSFLSKNAALRYYAAREILIAQNSPQHSLYFLLHGAIRCYYLDPSSGHEVTNNLIIMPGSIGIAGSTFVDGDKAMDWIQAIEDTDMVEIPLKKLAGAVSLPLFNQFVQAAESASIQSYKTLMEVRSLNVQARCDWLHKTHPELEDRVQKQYLASFLDMDKAVYSRCTRRRNDAGGRSEQNSPV